MAEARLIGVQGSMQGREFALGSRPLTLGRSDENDVVLSDEVASRAHAELRHENGLYILEDRGSTNGTFVNGARATVHQLEPGDQIAIGDDVFRFEVGEDRGATRLIPVQRLAANALRVI